MTSHFNDDEDEIIAAPATVKAPLAAPLGGDHFNDNEEASAPRVVAEADEGLVSDEAKAAAKAAAQRAKAIAQARAKQAGQAAQVAAAGLRTKFTELRGQSIGKACKHACVAIAVVTVLTCAGIEWHAHRTVNAPVVVQAPAPVKAVPVVPTPAPVVAAPVVAPTPTSAPVAVAPPPAVAAPAPVTVAPSASPAPVTPVVRSKPAPTDGPMNHLKPKSFNPMSPDYKPVTGKTKWEIEQEKKLDGYFHKEPKGG